MAEFEYIQVEVAYATPEAQMIVPVEVPVGATVTDAVLMSTITDHFPEIDPETNKLGIFGKRVPGDREVHAGDRVEIYRPLKADPKVVRRELAALGKTMGKPKSAAKDT